MARIDEILSSVIKGAQEAGAKIEQSTVGREEKQASIPGVVGGGMLGGLGGSLGGGLAGMGAASLAGRMMGVPPDQIQDLAALLGGTGAAVGGAGGALVGGQAGRDPVQPGLLEQIRGKFSSAEDAYLTGSKEAAEHFKVAFLPLLGMAASALAPMAARAGLSRIAGGALGKLGGGLVGRAAGGLASAAAKPVGGALFDMGVGSAASKMVQPQQPQ